LRRETKTESSEAPLPLPDICVVALKLRKEQQTRERETHARRWTDTGQYVDLGTGLPTSPNVHEVARQVRPEARVVYVDNDHCKSGCAHAFEAGQVV
jgi:hypothetical protein